MSQIPWGSVRLAAGVALWFFTAFVGLGFLAGALPDLVHLLETGAADRATVIVVALPPAALAFIAAFGLAGLAFSSLDGWGPLYAASARSLRRGAREYVSDFAAAFASSLSALTVVGVVAMYAVNSMTPASQQSTAGRQLQSLDIGRQALGSVFAGSTEEIAYVAIPFTALFAAAVVLGRRHRVPGWSLRLAVVCTGVLCVLARGVIHAYQGPIPAVAALCWSSANVLIYLRLRSVLALIAAHAIYDFAVAGLGMWVWVLPVALLGAAASAACVILRGYRMHRTGPRRGDPRREPSPRPGRAA